MEQWLAACTDLVEPAVLVTVATVNGSVPREPGAKMVVTPTRQFETIGGGNLELRACEIARRMLAEPVHSLTAERWLQRFPLGPALGQCCGGEVQLCFERIHTGSGTYLQRLAQAWRAAEDTWRLVPLDVAEPPTLVNAQRACLAGPEAPLVSRLDLPACCSLVRDEAGRRWLIDPCSTRLPHLVLFGAGHVGAAIVRALRELPCRITWVDEREDVFPEDLPDNVKVEVTDTPESEVDAAPPDAAFLVMTHSHALDQRLAECILKRTTFKWFGLIGSKTKRMQFEHRLRERGMTQERLRKMVCPIGLPGINGKSPSVIAASVCAQLLQVWEDDGAH